MKKIIRPDWVLISSVILIIFAYLLIHDLKGGTLLSYADHDSYTLQAMAWRQGRFNVDPEYSYPHLELAIYEGHYYVSFPPVPSVLLYPLTFIFGEAMPSNLVIILYVTICFVLVYLCFKKAGQAPLRAAAWAVFAVFGSNIMPISTDGGSWYQAQTLCFLFCTLAIYLTMHNKRAAALACVALAVGCRPFSIVFGALLFFSYCYFDYKDAEKSSAVLVKNLRLLAIPVLIGLIYCVYNYARFGNPLEFGHNYLPEFSEPGSEQFGIKYIPQNAKNIFFNRITFREGIRLEFTHFDGFIFYLANPIFLAWIIRLVQDIAKKRFDVIRSMLCGAFVLNLLFLLMHKTFGGWQFGARYTIDLIPYALAYILYSDAGLRNYELGIAAAAVMFNLYGTFILEAY